MDGVDCPAGRDGVDALRDWLRARFADGRFETLAQVTRLHRLGCGVEAALSCLEGQLAAALDACREAEQEASKRQQAAHSRRQDALRSAAVALAEFRGGVHPLEQKYLLHCGLDSPRLSAYGVEVTRRVSVCLQRTDIVLDPLTLILPPVPEAPAKKGIVGRVVGGGVGLLGGPLGVAAGVFLGSQFDTLIAGAPQTGGPPQETLLAPIRHKVAQHLSAAEAQVEAALSEPPVGLPDDSRTAGLHRRAREMKALIEISERLHSVICEWKGRLLA